MNHLNGVRSHFEGVFSEQCVNASRSEMMHQIKILVATDQTDAIGRPRPLQGPIGSSRLVDVQSEDQPQCILRMDGVLGALFRLVEAESSAAFLNDVNLGKFAMERLLKRVCTID